MTSTFRRASTTVAVATTLAVIAALRYPGGTPLDATTAGYSITRNFLSDLGMTVGYDGRANRLGAACFVVGLLTLVVGLGWSLASIIGVYLRDPMARRWARVACLGGLLSCVSFAGVAVTPENRVMAVHVGFTMWAWRFLPIVALCLTAASLRSRTFRRRAAAAWGVVTALVAAYVALLTWGPHVREPNGLVIQVVGQKVATVVVIAAVLFLAREADQARG